MARRRLPIHTILWRRVEDLGVEHWEVADRADVPLPMIEDILGNDADIQMVWSVGQVKRVLQVLDVDFLKLLRIKCAYCPVADRSAETLGLLPRNEIIIRRREELGLSRDDLLAKVGWTRWFEEFGTWDWAQELMSDYRAIEDGPDVIDRLTLGDIRLLNRVLRLPEHLLLGVRCGQCGR